MSYGWCRPCTSWDVFDGHSIDGGVHETMSMDSPGSTGDPMVQVFTTLSSMSPGINSGMDSSQKNQEKSSYSMQNDGFKIIDCDNPYKIEYFERQIFQQEPSESRRNVALNALHELGLKVYVVDEMAVKNTSDVVQHVNHFIRTIELDSKRMIASSTLGPQRCLLYQDQQSRLFNLVLSSNSEGPKRRWEEYLESFSTMRALSAFVLLLRSFPGLFWKAEGENHRPLYLAVIVGLILTEETSLAGANIGILVRNTPTHSALSLKDPIHQDAIRKICILALVIAASTFGWTQTAFTAIGVLLSCLLLLINIGARAWYFLEFSNIKRDRIAGSAVMPFLLSLFTGFSLSFMSSRISTSGGKRAIEHIIVTAICIAFVMILSDMDRFLKLVIIQPTVYDQTMVNLFLGSWWIASTLGSLCFAMNKTCEQNIPDGEHFLVEDASSPVGFRVPSLPRFEINEKLAMKPGRQSATSRDEFISAVVVVIIFAAAMGALFFTKVGEKLV